MNAIHNNFMYLSCDRERNFLPRRVRFIFQCDQIHQGHEIVFVVESYILTPQGGVFGMIPLVPEETARTNQCVLSIPQKSILSPVSAAVVNDMLCSPSI